VLDEVLDIDDGILRCTRHRGLLLGLRLEGDGFRHGASPSGCRLNSLASVHACARSIAEGIGEPKPGGTHPAVTLTRITPFRDGGILTKYFYTGMRVRDLERSIQFYRKEMGMKVTLRGRRSHGGIWVELKGRDPE